MNLYYGGFGKYQYYTVAESNEEAVKQIQEQYNLKALPVTVKEINDIDGYKIVPLRDEDEIKESDEIEEIVSVVNEDEEEVEGNAMTLHEYYKEKNMDELKGIAKEKGVKGYSNKKKDDLIEEIINAE